MTKPNSAYFIIFFHLLECAFAQKINADYRLNITKAVSDSYRGIMDEKAWEDGRCGHGFLYDYARDTSFAQVRTDVYEWAYDEEHLYLNRDQIIMAMEASLYGGVLRRDFSFWKNDNFPAFSYPFWRQTNGFFLWANAAAAQWMVSCPMGAAWTEWIINGPPKVTNYEDKWTLEAPIPLNRFATKKDFRMGI